MTMFKFLSWLPSPFFYPVPTPPIASPVPSIWEQLRIEARSPQCKENPMTISESIIKAAHEGIEAQQTVSDIEKAARAIAHRMGLSPDAMGFIGPARVAIGHVLVAPTQQEMRPLWTFFTQEAEAALNAVHK